MVVVRFNFLSQPSLLLVLIDSKCFHVMEKNGGDDSSSKFDAPIAFEERRNSLNSRFEVSNI